MSLVPDELRQCRAVNAQQLIRCRLKVTDVTAHIEDHRGPFTVPGGGALHWTNMVSVTCICPAGVEHLDGEICRKDAPAGTANPDRTVVREARLGQVGGDHYRKFKIQPWDVVDEYGLDFYAGGVLKYLLRAGRKGSKLEDLKKARHYLDKAIEREGG